MKAHKLFVLPLLAVLSIMLAATPAGSATDLPPGDDARVTRIAAGDSIEVLISGTGFTIGYLGVDAPDPATAKAKAQCYGAQALAFNTRLVKGQTLRVEREVSDFDANGRLLRWVFLPDGRLVNEEIVKGGYALATTLTPDSKYRERLAAAQQAAQAARRGMWGACPALVQSTATPAVVPEAAPEPAPEVAP
ncbi:MAG: thermonuclease family protein, partial [Chloroflexi bacterium]|nr:thermonuclease family protein [Chloroflexota bacterium]